MDLPFLIQTAASGVAIALLVALAAWARIARPTPPLDDAAVRDLLAFEFPGAPVDAIWIAADQRGAVVRSGDQALLVFSNGDGYVTRSSPWRALGQGKFIDGAIELRLADVGAPRIILKTDDRAAWPPLAEAAA